MEYKYLFTAPFSNKLILLNFYSSSTIKVCVLVNAVFCIQLDYSGFYFKSLQSFYMLTIVDVFRKIITYRRIRIERRFKECIYVFNKSRLNFKPLLDRR